MRSIPQSETFSAFLAQRPVARTRRLQCFVRQTVSTQSRLGVMVAKRWAVRAVDRHAFKRLVREAHLQWSTSSPSRVDLVIRLVGPVKSLGPSDRKLWWEELNQLFDRLPAL